MTYTKYFLVFGICALLSGCVPTEPAKNVKDVSSQNTATIFPPKIVKTSPGGLEIRYAQVSVGFDAGCKPSGAFSQKLNKCYKLPENVKSLALAHCAKYSKEAVFLGNKSNLLRMTVSKFRCA